MDFDKVLSLAVISLLGAMSPGPDFAIVTKNAMGGSLRAGVLTALGVFCALLVHISYCVLGIAIVIIGSPVLFNIIKYLGAAYLFYLGISLLLEKKKSAGDQNAAPQQMKRHMPFVSGFLCNLLNPKATLFILSLFTQFIDPQMSIVQKMGMGSVIAIVALLWFCLLSYLITHRFLHKHFVRFQFAISKVMGIALCGLALYILWRR